MGNTTSGRQLRPQSINDLASSTNFSEQEIRKWYHEFSKDFPSGYLGIDQFKDVYTQQFPNGDATKFAEHVFRTFDEDDNHKLSFREFMTALSVTARGSPEDRLRWAFEMYDVDESGYISRPECTEIIKAVYKMLGDNLTPELIRQGPTERAEFIFNLFDKDQDGKISEEEFVLGAVDEPILRSMLQVRQI